MNVRMLVVLLAAAAPCSGAQQEPIGDVIQIQGTWRLANGSSPLLAGESVAAGALIKADPEKGQGFVTVALLNKKQLSAACKVTPCTATLQMPAGYVEKDIQFENILAAVKFVLLNRSPKVANAYESTSSRGLAFSHAESIVPFDSSKPISFVPDFSSSPQGDYHLEVARLEDRRIITSAEIQLDRSHPQISFPMPEPGLYLASIYDQIRAANGGCSAGGHTTRALPNRKQRISPSTNSLQFLAPRFGSFIPASLSDFARGKTMSPDELLERGLEAFEKRAQTRAGRFWETIRRSRMALIVLAVSIAIMQIRELPESFSSTTLDAAAILQPGSEAAHVRLITIDEQDYQTSFGGRSPLDPGALAALVDDIARGRPNVIVVDLDTSHPMFRSLETASRDAYCLGRGKPQWWRASVRAGKATRRIAIASALRRGARSHSSG